MHCIVAPQTCALRGVLSACTHEPTKIKTLTQGQCLDATSHICLSPAAEGTPAGSAWQARPACARAGWCGALLGPAWPSSEPAAPRTGIRKAAGARPAHAGGSFLFSRAAQGRPLVDSWHAVRCMGACHHFSFAVQQMQRDKEAWSAQSRPDTRSWPGLQKRSRLRLRTVRVTCIWSEVIALMASWVRRTGSSLKGLQCNSMVACSKTQQVSDRTPQGFFPCSGMSLARPVRQAGRQTRIGLQKASQQACYILKR